MGRICWEHAKCLKRLLLGQSEILELEYLFHVFLKVLHVHCKLMNNKMFPFCYLKTNSTFRSSGLGNQTVHADTYHAFSTNSADQIRQIGPSLFAIASAYFEPRLYMLKIDCLIIAISHVGAR